MLGRSVGVCGVDSIVSGYGPMAGSCEYSDKPSGSGTTKLVVIVAQLKFLLQSSNIITPMLNCAHVTGDRLS
jgi:hypothetical protein